MAGVKDNRGGPGSNLGQPDPLAVFLSDPESHFSDLLYLNFRIYKKKLLWNFMKFAVANVQLAQADTLFIADVGASMGYDALFLLRKLTQNFRGPLPCRGVHLSLLEGNDESILSGSQFLKKELAGTRIDFEYYSHPLVEVMPLQDGSNHLAICSEVVEHLEEPERLLREIFRILRPGGFLMLTTDNIPSFLQHLKRIPVLLSGEYSTVYAKPTRESVNLGKMSWNGREYPIYGHINVNPTQHWERLCTNEGFEIASYGTYESIRRGGGSKSPLALAGYFALGALAYYCLPKSIGRFFGDTTALLLKKPAQR